MTTRRLNFRLQAKGLYRAVNQAEYHDIMQSGVFVIAIDVPAPVVAAFEMYWTKLDGTGPAYVARIDQLKRYIIAGEVTRGR